MHARTQVLLGLAALALVACPACISGAVDESTDVVDDAASSDAPATLDGETEETAPVVEEDTGTFAETSFERSIVAETT